MGKTRINWNDAAKRDLKALESWPDWLQGAEARRVLKKRIDANKPVDR